MRFGNYHVPDNFCLDVSRDIHIYLENIVINKHDTTGHRLRKRSSSNLGVYISRKCTLPILTACYF